MRFHRPSLQALAAVLTLALAFGNAANAAVHSFARVEPQGHPGLIGPGSQFDGPSDTHSSISAGIGFADAGAATLPGTIAGQAHVILSTGNPFASGSLTAFAQAFTQEKITVTDLVCVELGCTSLTELGATRVRMRTDIRASGTTASFGGTAFDTALASVDFGWQLAGVIGGTLSGGGSKSTESSGNVQGSIASQTITYDATPGSTLELSLSMSTFATASIAFFGSFGTSASASALSDFSHTLQWMGVSSLQAFDANGVELQLPQGARLVLAGASGMDFWNAAIPVTVAVPEPGSWALMVAGVAALGWRMRRQRAS